MVTFNDVGLLTAVPGLKIVDIIIGAPAISTMLKERVSSAGALFSRRRYDTRTVSVVVSIPNRMTASREAMRWALMGWCQSDTPAALNLEQVQGKHLLATCTDWPEFSVGDWSNSSMTIQFTATDPLFINDAVSTGSVGAPLTVGGQGPAITSIQQVASTTLTNPKWALSPGQYVELSGSIGPGTIDIDFNGDLRLVKLNGSPIMDKVIIGSRFFDLLPGSRMITGTNGAAGTVRWFERWL